MVTLKDAIKTVLDKVGLEIRRKNVHILALSPGSKKFAQAVARNVLLLRQHDITKIHYGCGTNFFGEKWVNVDWQCDIEAAGRLYMPADLTGKHPFPDDFFQFGFAGDFIEHLDQPDSLIFLTEIFRCFKRGGVMRLSFPGLEGVLHRHYTRGGGYEEAATARQVAYAHWAHKHFFSRDSISLVARHLGFTDIVFCEFGTSDHPELRGLEHRDMQDDMNIYVELTK